MELLPVEKKTTSEIIENAELPKVKNNLFWKIKRDDSGNCKDIKIDRLKFIEALYSLGFRRYDVDRSHLFISISNHRVIKEISKTIIEDSIFDHLRNEYDVISGEETKMPHVYVEDLINKLLYQRSALFNEEFLYHLKPKKPIILNCDTKEKKYIYYKNGFILVTKTGYSFHTYDQMNNYIWEGSILNREYSDSDQTPSVFEQFIWKICNDDIDRINAIKTIIGYNIHSYTNMKIKGTVLTDSKISDDDEPNGRTGKTLFCKAIGYMICNSPYDDSARTYCEINGKDFDPRNKNKYQQASIDTKMIILNDVRKMFDIEVLFNDITEGVTVERKNQDPFRIHPRIIITTNKTIRIDGDSAKDRFIEFEFSDYFHKSHSPEQEFKHWFFRDWNIQEWSRFDRFMINCIHEYLLNGLVEPAQINLNARKLRENTSIEFIEFMDSKRIKDGDRFNKTNLYNEFINAFTDFKNDKFKQNKFSRWITLYTRYTESLQEFNKLTDEEKSGNERYIIFRKSINK